MSKLQDVENKLDSLTISLAKEDSVSEPLAATRLDQRLPSAAEMPHSRDTGMSCGSALDPTSPGPHVIARPLTTPNNIILWPAISELLVESGACSASDLSSLRTEGTFWFIQKEMADKASELSATSNFLTGTTSPRDRGRIYLPQISFEQASEYSDAYFNTFNIMFPILNRREFRNEVLQHVIRDGYGDGDGKSVIALLVFALGQVAIEGSSGAVLEGSKDRTSGIRGGTALRPPGLDLFNEARRRMGLLLVGNTLEKVQTLLLQALYFDSGSYYADFWHSVVAASMACQVLIKTSPDIWHTKEGDMIKRAYWTCLINEDLFHIDLDLPRSSIGATEDVVPLPHFHDSTDTKAYVSAIDDKSFEFRSSHFLALITLRRILTRIDAALFESSRKFNPNLLFE